MAGKETDAKPEGGGVPEDWSGVGRLFVTRLIEVLLGPKTPGNLLVLIVILTLYHLGYLYLLQEEDRAGAQSPVGGLVEPIIDLVSADFWKWVFLTFFVISFGLNILQFTFYNRRVRKQGTELSNNRNNRIPHRVSSRDVKSLDDYDSEMRKKYGGNDDTKSD